MSKPTGPCAIVDDSDARRHRVLRQIAGKTALVLFPIDGREPTEMELIGGMESILALVRIVVPCCCSGPDFDLEVPCHHHPLKRKR